MREIKQLLILHQQGKGKKMIARTLDMSRNTVKSYLTKLEALLSAKNGDCLTNVIDLRLIWGNGFDDTFF